MGLTTANIWLSIEVAETRQYGEHFQAEGGKTHFKRGRLLPVNENRRVSTTSYDQTGGGGPRRHLFATGSVAPTIGPETTRGVRVICMARGRHVRTDFGQRVNLVVACAGISQGHGFPTKLIQVDRWGVYNLVIQIRGGRYTSCRCGTPGVFPLLTDLFFWTPAVFRSLKRMHYDNSTLLLIRGCMLYTWYRVYESS